jgi:DNA-binding MarR family transcriptional regulator
MAKKKRHELDNCACLNLRMASRTITQFYDGRFREIGLRSTQFNLLAAIGESGPVPMTRLADILVMDRTTLNRDLKPLVRDGLIVVSPGEDRRIRLVDLTEAGNAKLEEGLPVWKELQDDFYRAFGKKGWKTLMKGLEKSTLVARKIARKKNAQG